MKDSTTATLDDEAGTTKLQKRLSRLYRAVESASDGMEQFRERRTKAIKKIVGEATDDGTEEVQYVNQMRFANYVYTRQLSPRNPQGLFTTRADAYKRQAAELQIVTNETISKMNLARTIEQAIQQAMTAIGVVKTGISHSDLYAIDGYKGDGYPYCCTVDLDDFVFDLYAKRWEEVEFIGNFYRVPIEDLKANPAFDQAVVKQLEKAERRPYTDEGNERADTVSRGEDTVTDEFYDYADVCDLYLPRTKEFLTVSAEFGRHLPPLREAKWEGPDWPYDLLWFYDVDGQLMPLPPAAFWTGMNDLINELYLKLQDQALRQKKVGFANAQKTEEAKAVIEAKDGQVVPTTGNPSIAEMSFGGVDNNTLGFVTFCMSIFNKMNWNIEVVAGLGPQSNTLGQDEMISASANKQLQDMQERTFRFTERIIRKVAWCILTDPLVDVEITKELKIRPDIKVKTRYTSDSQAGTIFDHNVQIHPYSMQFTSPAARLNSINGFIQGVVAPLGQMMQQQGITIDWTKFVDLWSQYSQLPEIKDLVKFSPTGPIPPEDAPLRKPPTSTRNYVRRNVKDTSPDAERQQLMTSLMSNGGQGNQN